MLALLALGAGCSFALVECKAQPLQPTVRDSAGVRIVSYAGTPAGAPLARIELRPALSVGGLRLPASYELDVAQPLISATFLSDGRFVVNERTQLSLFERTGAFVRAAGRAGAGPGEFRQIGWSCRIRGDSVLAVDYSTGSISVWSSDLRLVASFTRPGFVPPGACRSDGKLLVRIGFPRASAVTAGHVEAEYRLMRPDGSATEGSTSHPAEYYAGPIAFEPSFGFVDSLLVVANPQTGEIRVHDARGVMVRSVRIGGEPRRVTDREWQALVASMAPRGSSPAMFEARLSRLRPPHHPFFRRVFVDPAGRIFIQNTFESRSFIVIGIDGRFIGRLAIPEGELADVSARGLIVRVLDDDGARRLVIFSMPQLQP